MKRYCLKDPEGNLLAHYIESKKKLVREAVGEHFGYDWKHAAIQGYTIVPIRIKEIKK